MGCSASKVDAHDADEIDAKSRDFNATAAAEEEKAPEEVVVPAKRRSSLEAIKETIASMFEKDPSPSKGSGNAPVFLAWLGLAGVVVADKSCVDKVFGGVNKVADKVPGGFIVKGATGATSSVPVWKSTSEIGCHRADAVTGTTSHRWRGTSTPSRRRSYGSTSRRWRGAPEI
jgi:hypothetical protein